MKLRVKAVKTAKVVAKYFDDHEQDRAFDWVKRQLNSNKKVFEEVRQGTSDSTLIAGESREEVETWYLSNMKRVDAKESVCELREIKTPGDLFEATAKIKVKAKVQNLYPGLAKFFRSVPGEEDRRRGTEKVRELEAFLLTNGFERHPVRSTEFVWTKEGYSSIGVNYRFPDRKGLPYAWIVP